MLRRDAISTTLSRISSYAKRWSYETRSPGVGGDTQGLEHNDKIPKSNPLSALSSRWSTSLPTQRLLSHVHALRCVATLMISAMTIAVSILWTSIDAVEGHCPSYVRFQAPWQVDCCTCSRQELAQGGHPLRCSKLRLLLRVQQTKKRCLMVGRPWSVIDP